MSILEHVILPVIPGREADFELADHDPGFRGAPEYPQWKALLHEFYDPFPVVEHFTRVAEVRS